MAGTNQEFLREQKLKEVENYLQKAAKEAKACNISEKELTDMLKLFYEGE